VGIPSKQRCTQEIQDHIGQRYAYERMAAGRKVKNGTGSNMKNNSNEKLLSYYLLWQVDHRVSCRIPCVFRHTRTLLFAGLAVSRTTVAELGER